MLTTADKNYLKKTFVTKIELKKELSRFATKQDLKKEIMGVSAGIMSEFMKLREEFVEFKNEIREEMQEFREKMREMGEKMEKMEKKQDARFNNFMNVFDTVMGEIKTSREEQSALFYRQKKNTNKIERHEVRIAKIEANFALAG